MNDAPFGRPRNAAGRFHADGNYVSYSTEVVRMYLCDSDNRAAKVAEKDGFIQRRLFNTWDSLIRATEPTTIFDVGANYGEMSLPLLLPSGCELHAFEPSPYLADALDRSVSTHLQSSAFHVIRSAVSDSTGTHVFNVDRKWSGTSSLDFQRADSRFKGEGPQQFEVIEVPTTSLDEYAAGYLTVPHDATLALKIDVEGHEPRVFRGARRLLRDSSFFALFEFSSAQLALAGFEPQQFLAELIELGRLYVTNQSGGIDVLTVDDAATVRHGDFILSNISELATAAAGS